MKPDLPDPNDPDAWAAARRRFQQMTREQQLAELQRMKRELQLYSLTLLVKAVVAALAGACIGRILTYYNVW